MLGQYTAADGQPGYLDDPTVPDGSCTPTFASMVLYIDNDRQAGTVSPRPRLCTPHACKSICAGLGLSSRRACSGLGLSAARKPPPPFPRRWAGVPFVIKAGKALDGRKAEIRLQLRATPHWLFGGDPESMRNELVVRLQPDEAIYTKLVVKKPGGSRNCTQLRAGGLAVQTCAHACLVAPAAVWAPWRAGCSADRPSLHCSCATGPQCPARRRAGHRAGDIRARPRLQGAVPQRHHSRRERYRLPVEYPSASARPCRVPEDACASEPGCLQGPVY